MKRNAKSSRSSASRSSTARRTRVVWGALLGAMTVVGGLLWALDGAKGPSSGGWALPALVASAGPRSYEGIFSTKAPITPGRWQGIVIHHSGSVVGTPASLDSEAQARGLKGLGYHFVLGNGSGIGDGEVHVGYRWMQQRPGAHAAGKSGEWYNLNTIGICVIGDGDRKTFTPEQMTRLVGLVNSLCRELNIPADRVVLHRDIATTTSPGELFPQAWFREQLTKLN
ncbi:MAG: N-acetylmuramoyl-L-alanine amidase [Phycisphaerales bacterium]|nr:N-acetylmuramoyl-L-alanine amidase [Phycisphaerales bacterium]